MLELLATRIFSRRDFAETARGVCRVNPATQPRARRDHATLGRGGSTGRGAVTQLLARSEGSRIKQVSTPLTGRNRSARYEGKRRTAAAAPAPRCKRCDGPLPRRDRIYCDDCLPHYQREQYQQAFHGSGLMAIEEKKAVGADPTHGATAAVRRADTNVTRKREAREWDERHGKLVDLSAFQRDILPLIQDDPAQPAAAGDRSLTPLRVADPAG